MLTFKNILFSQSQLLHLWQKRINTVGRISEISKTRDKGMRITSWLASRFPTQDPSWEARAPGFCGLRGSAGHYTQVP